MAMKLSASLTLSMVILLTGCGVDKRVSAITAEFGNVLNDPASLQLKDVKHFGEISCGQFNAKNEMGGYSGYKSFIHHKDGIVTDTFVNGSFSSKRLTFGETRAELDPEQTSYWCTDGSFDEKTLRRKIRIVQKVLAKNSESALLAAGKDCERATRELDETRGEQRSNTDNNVSLALAMSHLVQATKKMAETLCAEQAAISTKRSEALEVLKKLEAEPVKG